MTHEALEIIICDIFLDYDFAFFVPGPSCVLIYVCSPSVPFPPYALIIPTSVPCPIPLCPLCPLPPCVVPCIPCPPSAPCPPCVPCFHFPSVSCLPLSPVPPLSPPPVSLIPLLSLVLTLSPPPRFLVFRLCLQKF